MTAAYYALIGLLAVQRLIEVGISRRNLAWSLARGGMEFGRGHFVFMKLLHAAFLIGCVSEVHFLERPFRPGLGLAMIVLLLLGQGLRFWCMRTLGPRWNARVVVVPGLERVKAGPYRWFPHPNYVAVVLEGIAVPMIHGAWITAIAFTIANGWLLFVRLRCEELALSTYTH